MKKLFHQNISIRLTVYSVLISIILAFISSTVILVLEYNTEKKRLVASAKLLLDTTSPQLAKSLWEFDADSKELYLDALKNSNLISQIILMNPSTPEESIVYREENQTLIKLTYSGDHIGYLVAGFNFPQIKTTAIKNFRLICYIFISTLLLMGIFLYLLVNRLIINNITKITAFARKNTDECLDNFSPLILKRQGYEDEINHLVDAINQGKKSSIELLEARRDYEQQMEYQLNYDLLTNLPNRHNLELYIKSEIESYVDEKGIFVIVLIDMDDFKLVNDNVGHAIGDEILKIAAKRIKLSTDKYDGYTGRLGSDEFICCFYTEDKNAVKQFAQDIIQSFEEKIRYKDFYYRLGCSIGVTLYPEHNIDEYSQLILNADKAKHKAKELGKNTYFIFDKVMIDRLILERRIKSKISEAFENNRFQINYQPLIDISNDKIAGFEALIRWHDEEIGWVRPDIFIEIAEQMGLMFYIDSWVFRNAVQQVKVWRERFHQDFIISINFSPTNFYHANFAEHVSSFWLTEKDLSWVELEITERLMLNNDNTVINGLDLIRRNGIRFSIDDFGIGYSSLGYINKFSHYLSKIKVDRMFIKNINVTDFDIAFVESIKLLADNLKLDLLAEGVEDEEQVNKLKQVDCQYVQGYFYSKPLPPEDILSFIENWEVKHAVINTPKDSEGYSLQ